MNYKSFNLGDWIGHISGVIEDETTLDGNEMRDLVKFLSTLEQEPILDKIRAEISDFEEEVFNRPNTDYSDYAAVRHCLEIIDKYKAEVEPRESEDKE